MLTVAQIREALEGLTDDMAIEWVTLTARATTPENAVEIRQLRRRIRKCRRRAAAAWSAGHRDELRQHNARAVELITQLRQAGGRV